MKLSIRIKDLPGILLSIYVLYLQVNTATSDINHGVKLVLKVKKLGVHHLFHDLNLYNFTKYDQLTPTTYLLVYNGSKKNAALQQEISNIKSLHKTKILELELTREYNDTLKPVDQVKSVNESELPETVTNLVCDNYYGIGIQEAWSRGYTGKGVTIAITDVGINTDLLDLQQNINMNMSFNFVDNNVDVTPEYFHNIRDKASYYTDHGNKMASIIAATKGNNLCSAGIAHDATIIALKIFKVTKTNSDFLQLHPRHYTSSDICAKALGYRLQVIDIFANAWAPVNPFDKLDMATKDVISYGASKGRRGLGSIHVVPSGPPGSQLSNNINTITVNGVGRNGTILKYTYTDASVLTSGLGDGNNLTSSSMVTTSLNNRCISEFKGVSAATAQIAAIIALGLQANKKLTLRDVQHLLVISSEYKPLKEKMAFRRNAAGRRFHPNFGFGLLNATKFVKKARKHAKVQSLRQVTLETFTPRKRQRHTQTFEKFYECEYSDKSKCLSTVEHVVLRFDLNVNSRADMEMTLISPHGTRSNLLEFKNEKEIPIVEQKLQLVSVHFWNEIAYGTWKLNVQEKSSASIIRVTNLSLEIYGTADSSLSTAQYRNVCKANDKSKVETTTSKLQMKKLPKYDNVIDENFSNRKSVTIWLPLFIVLFLMCVLAFCIIKFPDSNFSKYCNKFSSKIKSFF